MSLISKISHSISVYNLQTFYHHVLEDCSLYTPGSETHQSHNWGTNCQK